MRILLVSADLPPAARGGAEANAADAAVGLAARHTVCVLSGASGTLPGVQHRRLPRLPPLSARASLPAKTLWHLRDQWMPTVHVSTAAAITAFQPDVVYTHAIQGLSGGVFSAIRSSGIPHVHIAHDLHLLCVQRSMTRNAHHCGEHCIPCLLQRSVRTRLLGRNTHALIAPSEYVRTVHVRHGIFPHLWKTVRLGVHPGRARLRAPTRVIRLGFIGELAPHKGVRALLRAFSETPSNLRLTMGGAGPLEPLVRSHAAGDPRLEFSGYLLGSRKESFFHEIDVLVVPSEIDEAAGLVAIEAAARGVPALVSDRGALPEIPHSMVFRGGDPDAFVAALRSLVDRPGQIELTSAKLLRDCDQFLVANHLAAVEGLLETAASRRSPG